MLCDDICQCKIHARKFNICYMNHVGICVQHVAAFLF